LTERTLARAVRELARRDPDLGAVVEQHGMPPLWGREPGFPTLVLIVLEQQVSLASARAAYDRLLEAVSPLTPERFLELDDVKLRGIGFSRQKTGYVRGIAEALASGALGLDTLAALGDEEARDVLIAVRGLGAWSADVYLTMALRRPDAFPSGDLALLVSAQRVKRLETRPTPLELEALAEPWRPYRAAGARILWHAYLSERAAKTARATAATRATATDGVAL
jgi:DNA-3-methyladenine glycosylase II